MDQYLTVKAAAMYLHKGESTIWRWIQQGKLESIDIAGRTCVQYQDLIKAEANVFTSKQERIKNFNDTRKMQKNFT